MDLLPYTTHPVRCIIARPSECGESVFLTIINLNIIDEFEKMYIYSPSLHHYLYQKLNKTFSIYIPITIIPKILIEEDVGLIVDEILNKENFEKSDTELETNESIEELIYPKYYDNGGVNIPEDLNETK